MIEIPDESALACFTGDATTMKLLPGSNEFRAYKDSDSYRSEIIGDLEVLISTDVDQVFINELQQESMEPKDPINRCSEVLFVPKDPKIKI